MSEAPVVELEEQVSSYYKLALNGTTFVIHDDALEAFHTRQDEALPHYLRRAHAELRLGKAKRSLARDYDCVPNGRVFYILGPKPNGQRAPAREEPAIGPEEADMLHSNVFESSSLASSQETKYDLD